MEQNSSYYKDLYIPKELAEEISKIAENHNTTFNNVIISIIDEFLRKQKYTLD